MSKYALTISRLTVDKLGVKLYDRVAAVIAELISNSYDADATEVFVEAPMGQLLATVSGGIVVKDNGHGMIPDEINDQYLRVGTDRRTDRGDTSPKFKRKVLGRKGVGKLAPFGICKTIEVVSAGGKKVSGKDGKKLSGYRTAHLILRYDEMLKDEKKAYAPEAGPLDETVSASHGTTIRLRDFAHRSVPQLEDFSRQLAHRFGIAAADWKIVLHDTTKTPSSDEYELAVGEFDAPIMDQTKVEFKAKRGGGYSAVGPDGKELKDIEAGFVLEGEFYPILGWVAYSKAPYGRPNGGCSNLLPRKTGRADGRLQHEGGLHGGT